MFSHNTRQAYQNCFKGAHIRAFQLPDLILDCLSALSTFVQFNEEPSLQSSAGPHDQLLPLLYLSCLSLLHEWGPSGPGQRYAYLHIPSHHLITYPLEDKCLL